MSRGVEIIYSALFVLCSSDQYFNFNFFFLFFFCRTKRGTGRYLGTGLRNCRTDVCFSVFFFFPAFVDGVQIFRFIHCCWPMYPIRLLFMGHVDVCRLSVECGHARSKALTRRPATRGCERITPTNLMKDPYF